MLNPHVWMCAVTCVVTFQQWVTALLSDKFGNVIRQVCCAVFSRRFHAFITAALLLGELPPEQMLTTHG